MKFKIIPNEQTPKTTNKIFMPDDNKLLEKFLSFARRQHNCTGLASNQVSLDGKRITKTLFAIKVDRFWDIVVNPKINQYIGDKEEKEEGCLTWLGKTIIAERSRSIEVTYYNIHGNMFRRIIRGFEAQVWQHEYNHLMGVEEKFLDKGKV